MRSEGPHRVDGVLEIEFAAKLLKVLALKKESNIAPVLQLDLFKFVLSKRL